MSVKDTVNEHKSVITSRGAVWVGKAGKPLGAQHINRINQQCERGVKMYLFLVQNVGRPGKADYRIYQCKVMEMNTSLPEGQTSFVPKYYNLHPSLRSSSLWSKVESIKEVKPEVLKKYHIASSQRRVSQALQKSLAAMFVLGEGEGMDW